MKNLFVVLFVSLFFVFCGGQKPAEKTEKPVTTTTESIPVAVAESAPVMGAGEEKATQPASAQPTPPVSENKPEELPKLWDFFATWCSPCRQQAPIIEELAAEYKGQIEIRSIDTDKEQELARKFNIQAIPTLVFLDATGKELSRHVGFFPKDSIIARFRAHGFIR